MISLIDSPSGLFTLLILTQTTIKTYVILLLSLLFLLAIVLLSPEAEGKPYTQSHIGYVSSTSIDHQKPRMMLTSPVVAFKHAYEDNVTLGQQIANLQGITDKEWVCLYNLGMKESGWNHLATNKASGAFGIPQSLPASKIDTFGDRYDPAVQIRWMLNYISVRYGTPCKAYYWQVAHNWY